MWNALWQTTLKVTTRRSVDGLGGEPDSIHVGKLQFEEVDEKVEWCYCRFKIPRNWSEHLNTRMTNTWESKAWRRILIQRSSAREWHCQWRFSLRSVFWDSIGRVEPWYLLSVLKIGSQCGKYVIRYRENYKGISVCEEDKIRHEGNELSIFSTLLS